MPSSRVRTPTPSPRHRRQMREVQLPDRIYTYRPSDASAGGMAYLDPGADIHLTRLWSAPAGQFPDAPPYYREGDPPPLDTVPSASDDDPAGWRAGKKVINIGLVAVFAFVTALTAAIFVPSAIELEDELGPGNRALGELAVSLFVFGGALGALIAPPASEAWGRAPVYRLSGAAFAGLTAACGAASSRAELLACRFLAGLFGSVPLVVGAATVAEVVPADGPPARRAVAMAILVAASLLGTVAGPVVGGTLVDAKGWRWVFWAFGAASAVLALLMVLALRETCPAAIERRRAVRAARIGALPEPLAAPPPRRGRSGAPPSPVAAASGMSEKKYHINYSDKNDTNSNNNGETSDWLLRGYVFFSPVAGAMAVYTTLLFGCFYLMLASVPFVFAGAVYDLGERGMELTYLGVGVGALLGLAYYSAAVKVDAARRVREEHDDTRSDKRLPSSCAHCRHCLQEAEAGGCDGNNDQEPEDRLRPLRLCAFSVPLGLAIYGWTASAGALWVLPVFGSATVGFGVAGVLAATQLYMVEAFPGFPSTAVASSVMLRSLMAGGLPVAGPAMIRTLGVGWCGTVLAVVALGLVPVPWLLVRYGDTMRRKFAPRGL